MRQTALVLTNKDKKRSVECIGVFQRSVDLQDESERFSTVCALELLRGGEISGVEPCLVSY